MTCSNSIHSRMLTRKDPSHRNFTSTPSIRIASPTNHPISDDSVSITCFVINSCNNTTNPKESSICCKAIAVSFRIIAWMKGQLYRANGAFTSRASKVWPSMSTVVSCFFCVSLRCEQSQIIQWGLFLGTRVPTTLNDVKVLVPDFSLGDAYFVSSPFMLCLIWRSISSLGDL